MDSNNFGKTVPIVALSRQLETLKTCIGELETPPQGWIHKIRTTTNMPLKHIAKKAKVTIEAIKAYEKSEAPDSNGKRKISIATLEKAAEAMDMKLVYFMVPKEKPTLLEVLDEKLKAFEEERNQSKKEVADLIITKPPHLYYADIPKEIWEEAKPKLKTIDLSSLVKPPSQNIPD